MIKIPKNFTKSNSEFDFKGFSEKIEILSNIAEHTITTIPILFFSEVNLLIAQSGTIHIETEFNHGLPDFSVSINAINQLFSHINQKTKLSVYDDVLHIRSGKLKAQLPKILQDENDPIYAHEREEVWAELPKEFYKALESCKIALSTEKGFKWILNNYGLIGKEMIATDNVRVSVYDLKVVFDDRISLTQETAKLINTVKPTHYSIAENYISFKNKDYYFKVAKLTENYPELDSGLFYSSGYCMVNRKRLISAIERVKIFSGNSLNIPEEVTLVLSEKILKLESKNSFGSAEDKIKVDSNCDLVVKCSPDYLLDILKVLSSEEIKIGLTEEKLVFKEDNFNHCLALIV